MNRGLFDVSLMVAIDLKAGTDHLLAEAQRYGRAFDAIVDIIHVASPDPEFIGYIKSNDPKEQNQFDSEREPRAKALRNEHQHTQALAATLRANGVRVDQALTVQGATITMIIEEARRLNSNLIILGSHQHGALYRLWHEDTATEAARLAPCPLLVVPIPN